MQCEMCGKDTTLFLTNIEGSELNVCKACGQHGKIIKRVKTPEQIKREEKRIEQEIKTKEPEKETLQLIVDDYAKLVKDAREKLNLKQEDFAKKINEKQNLIHHIETGKMEPDLTLARKLEKFLNIELVKQETFVNEKTEKTKSDKMTIGDLITIKKRK